MPLYEFEGKKPKVGQNTFIHPNAVVIGDVVIGDGCYIGPGAALRGDWAMIRIGNGCNIQENCIFHAHWDEMVVLEDECHIGHGAILHQATLGKHVLVGMGAIVGDRTRIGEGAVIGAGCVVLADQEIPPYKVVVGVPGKVIGDVKETLAAINWEATRMYQGLPARYAKAFREVPLEECLQ